MKTLGAVLCAAFFPWALGVMAQEPAPPPPQPVPDASPAAVADPGATVGAALAFFMNSRDYRTLRELKSILTPAAQATYEHDAVAYNGKKGIRLAAYDYRDPGAKPNSTSYTATVKTLWDDQGEAVEQRTESVRLTREANGPWRVAGLSRVDSQPLRFKDAIAGVTTLRTVLRAWVKRDAAVVKANLTEALVKRLQAKGDTIEGFVTGDAALRHAAFRIDDVDTKETTGALARVHLVESHNGHPGSLDGAEHTLTLVKKGSRWLVDDWK